MRILIVTQYFWPENFRINDLAQGLKECGHRVTVLTGKPNYPGGRFFQGYGLFDHSREDYGGIQVLRVPLLPRGQGALRLMLNFFSFAVLASLLAPLRCRDDYDVIFVYEPSPVTVCLPALLLGKLRGTPVVFWVQDLWPESLSATGAVKSRWVLKRVEQLVRFIYRRCDLILVQSRAFIPSVEALGGAGRVHYFPNSAEALYRPVRLPESAMEHTLMPHGFRVMFAGNVGVAQDFGTILAAAEILKSHAGIQWVILGGGRMLPWVQEQIAARGLGETVHLLGQHPVESMPGYFSLADVMLVTLKKEPIFALTIPSKVQSYLACGKPVVAAMDGEGARIVAESGAGLAVPAGDARGLAEAVLWLYGLAAEERCEMGERGLQYFRENFERGKLLGNLEAWFDELARQDAG